MKERAKQLYHRLFLRRYRIDWGAMHVQPFNVLIDREQPADWLIGCNMVYRKQLLDEVGRFSAQYGKYGFDDQDIAVRIRRLGYRLISTPKLNLEHYPSKANREVPRLFFEEEARRQVLFAEIAIGDRSLWRQRFLARQILYMVPRVPSWILRGKAWMPSAMLRGIKRGFEEVSRSKNPSS
jgi:GT2 family glycosyltransferase